CPFHDDRNPSMHIDEEKGLFHCFSCGAGGDILWFYMRYNNTTFPEALQELAKRANIPIEKTAPRAKGSSAAGALFKINSIVSKYYQKTLEESARGKPALEYIAKRGIPRDVATEFGLGYAPEGWDNLAKFLTKHKAPLGLAERVGLLVRRNSGDGHYDRFRGRLMFPIVNVDGKVIGFGGRVIDGEGEPKYINSPESEVYHKRSSFYGLDKSRDHIRRARRAIIVEGYMDFLSVYVSGIKNVVATLGTALTRDHVGVLKRYTDRYVVIFDGDESGIKAAVRSLDVFLEEGLLPNVVILPEGTDPDSFLSERGKDALLSLIENAPGLLDFYIDNTVREYRSGAITLNRSVKEIADVLTKVNDPIAKNGYARKAAEKLGVRENEVMSLIRFGKGKAARPASVASAVSSTEASHALAGNSEKTLLAVLLKFPELSEIARAEYVSGDIANPEIRAILEEMLLNDVLDASALLQIFQDRPGQALITEALFSSPGISDRETAGRTIERCIKKVKQRKLDDRLKLLRLRIDEAVRNKDSELEKEILKEYSELRKLK
ncbi:MAG: DNA primase, partial [Candidatus Dadabacteria bacterium]